VDAGEEARIREIAGSMRRSAIDPAQMVFWHPRHLTFSGESLAHKAEDFNRYNRKPAFTYKAKCCAHGTSRVASTRTTRSR
jgi:ferric-dicitrate binding protein FerR (iron transport regulator)